MKIIVAVGMLAYAFLMSGCAAYGETAYTGRFSWGAQLAPPVSSSRERADEWVGRLGIEMPAMIPLGGTVLLFDLEHQRFAAYENGVIAERRGFTVWGPISSGMRTPKYRTPAGKFRIAWKSKLHWSEKYEAEMPHAAFFGPQGEAIHAGVITRPFASHGCIRVSPVMAAFLWREGFYDLKKTTIIVVNSLAELDRIVAAR
jgi:hypothetical protein